MTLVGKWAQHGGFSGIMLCRPRRSRRRKFKNPKFKYSKVMSSIIPDPPSGAVGKGEFKNSKFKNSKGMSWIIPDPP